METVAFEWGMANLKSQGGCCLSDHGNGGGDIGAPAGGQGGSRLPKNKKMHFFGQKMTKFGQNKSHEFYLYITYSSGYFRNEYRWLSV